MIARLETMVLMGMDIPLPAIRRQIASGIDIIVHLGRLRDKSRRLLAVTEVMGYKDGEVILKPLYTFEETGEVNGKIQGIWKKDNELEQTAKLLAAGYKPEGAGENARGDIVPPSADCVALLSEPGGGSSDDPGGRHLLPDAEESSYKEETTGVSFGVQGDDTESGSRTQYGIFHRKCNERNTEGIADHISRRGSHF